MYQKYIKYFPAILLVGISLPEMLENLQVWGIWLEELNSRPWVNYTLFGSGLVMFLALLTRDIRAHRRAKSEEKTKTDSEEKLKLDLLLREKLSSEQLLEVEKERIFQATELEKDRRNTNAGYFIFIVFTLLVVFIVKSCGGE